MIFAWDELNCEHLAKHSVSAAEAQEIILTARRPFPQELGDGKLVVWGQTAAGRYLQVIFVLKAPREVPYESLCVEDWLEIEARGLSQIVRVIHAMELTLSMKKGLRKRRR
jgi:hypothetical protein